MKGFAFSVILLLFAVAACKKETAIEPPDFRDKLIGTYVAGSYSWASYPTPPTYFDSVYYNNDTVYIQVAKSEVDSLSVVVMGDTFSISSYTDTTAYSMIGCCHNEKIVQWWNDSIRIMHNTGGSPASSFGNGWLGKRQ